MKCSRLLSVAGIIPAFFLFQMSSFAQEGTRVVLDKISPADFKLPVSAVIDSNASAVILSSVGSIHFVGNSKGWFSYVYKRHVRIKILDKKAFHLATEKIYLYNSEHVSEKIAELAASTYNLEDGAVKETKLDPKEVYNEKEDKLRSQSKFTMPAVKEGSIIEYAYSLVSDYIWELPDWQFQSFDDLTLYSEFQIEIPQTLLYVMVRQGTDAFVTDKGSRGHASYLVSKKSELGMGAENNYTVTANTDKHLWVMKNIPAFKIEPFLTTSYNYVDKIAFQLEKTYNGEDWHDYNNSWAKTTEDLLKRDDFGQGLSDDNPWLADWLKNMPPSVHGDAGSGLETAKSVYYYVSGHLSCTRHYGMYLKSDLRDVIRHNSGSVGDINLLLIAALRSKGISADPVILSTRENGFTLAKYPILERLDYVIAKVVVDGKVYYLDATHPQLGFGQLADNCYNGHARVISNTDSASVYFEPDSLKSNKVSMAVVTFGKSGPEGNVQTSFGMQESYDTRQKVSELGQEGYFRQIETSFGDDWKISNTEIDSLTKLEYPLTIRYDFSAKDAADGSLIYLNPFFGERLSENPFKSAVRKYPVEMPYTTDKTYILTLTLPDGYDAEEMPKSVKSSFNGNEGSFEYIIGKSEGLIQLRCRLVLNKAVFSPDDYDNLRDFFGFVVKKESEQIVLRKK